MRADPWNPPMFPGFDSGSVSYMFVGLVCCWFSPRSKSFSTGTLVFLPPKKPTFCKFWNSTWIIFLPKCWSWFNFVSNFILDIATDSDNRRLSIFWNLWLPSLWNLTSYTLSKRYKCGVLTRHEVKMARYWSWQVIFWHVFGPT